MTVAFQLDGQEFVALNGGPQYKFTEAVSFVVNCQTQEEVDEYWKKLSDGGQEVQCGWLKDKYGLSWQIVPTILSEMLNDPDPKKADRVMKAMLQMKKIDIKGLKQAYEQQWDKIHFNSASESEQATHEPTTFQRKSSLRSSPDL